MAKCFFYRDTATEVAQWKCKPYNEVSPPKEALGEGGYEADLDQQADHRLESGELGDCVFQAEAARKEPASVKRGNTED